jgi:hypothetical protein
MPDISLEALRTPKHPSVENEADPPLAPGPTETTHAGNRHHDAEQRERQGTESDVPIQVSSHRFLLLEESVYSSVVPIANAVNRDQPRRSAPQKPGLSRSRRQGALG